ncbi:MAG: hypothetical protein COA78_26680 [Blastopirellula sp.]|nr:MAG: hypothetical protein COA78_26680 [Blastopirellula sp.]
MIRRAVRKNREGKTAPAVVIVLIVVAGLGFFVLVCGGIVVALILPGVQQARTAFQESRTAARTAARRMSSTNNLKQIALALHNYHDTYQTLPPAYFADEDGTPQHSWRVIILPFLEQNDLYDQYDFDQPWDSPANKQVLNQMPDVYNNPNSVAAAVDPTATTYQAISGTNTVFDGTQPISFAAVTDGLSNTVWMVENYGRPVPWTKPVDISPADYIAGKPFNGNPMGGINVGFADGSVQFFPNDTPKNKLEATATINDGLRVPF